MILWIEYPTEELIFLDLFITFTPLTNT